VEAGQMQGPAASLKIEDFWYLAPLERARKVVAK
jgi:NitT/TauT family transport system substrate-binding protein